MQKNWGDDLVMEGECVVNDGVKAPQVNQLNHNQATLNRTSFTQNGVTVHVKFSEDGKGLNELLVNYFKSLN